MPVSRSRIGSLKSRIATLTGVDPALSLRRRASFRTAIDQSPIDGSCVSSLTQFVQAAGIRAAPRYLVHSPDVVHPRLLVQRTTRHYSSEAVIAQTSKGPW